MGYIDRLIYNIDFVQEVMLDARVSAKFPLSGLYKDKLCEKLVTMNTFLREIYQADVQEKKSFMSKGVSSYGKIFKPKLITLEMVRQSFESIHRLLDSQKKIKPANSVEYDEVLNRFEKLFNEARSNNIFLFGIDSVEPPEPE